MRSIPAFKPAIINILLCHDPTICDKLLRYQFKQLIIDPITKVGVMFAYDYCH